MELMPLLRRYLLPLLQARAGQRPTEPRPDTPGKDDHRAAQ
ncbi:hypothetical protein [Stutzerimonas stutzeri]|nr:hypothetical protein [Stutzerimonas stutzeri]